MQILIGLAWLAAALAAVVLLPIAIFAMLCIGVFAWALGAHVKIKQSGKEVGYIKWFTYYPSKDYVMDKAVSNYFKKR